MDKTAKDSLVEQMTQRFLGWLLPEDFNPDGGIKFSPVSNEGTRFEYRFKPIGTNLFNYEQAKAMVEHMIDGLAFTDAARIDELQIGVRNAQADVVNTCKRIAELEAQLAAERGALSSHVRKALGLSG